MKEYKILLSFNDNYAPHAAVVMESIIEHASSKVGFIIMYFSDELSDSVRDTLYFHLKGRVKSLEFYSVSDSNKVKFDGIEYSKALTVNTFLRLFAPDVLTKETFVLYLDCDLIVNDDIFKLFQEVDENQLLCAVPEYYPINKRLEIGEDVKIDERLSLALHQDDVQRKVTKYLGMSYSSSYFNAGVLFMNLNKIREFCLLDKVLQFLVSHPNVHAGDQDALNGVLNGNYGILPLWWNVHPYIYNLHEYTSNYSVEELKHAQENPSIIHFAGYKAWQYRFEDNKVKKMYWDYRKRTPWPDKCEQGKTFSLMIRKYLINPLRRIVITLIGYQNMQKLKKNKVNYDK